MPTLLDVLDGGRDEDLALVVPGRLPLSYGRLREEVWRAAGALAGAGIGRGDRVALVYPNSGEAVVLFLAAALAGTAAPLNPAYKEQEFAFSLQDIGARALLVPPGGAGAARQAAPPDTTVIEAAFDEAGSLRVGRLAGSGRVEAPGEDDVALVLHTSGTTSRPKLVPLRQRNLAASVANIVASYRLTPADVSLCLMPLFHVHGLIASALSALGSGGSVVVPPRFSPFEFRGLVRDHGVTWYSAVPTIHQLLAARGGRGESDEDPGTLRFARSCSSALPPDLMQRLEDLLGVPVLEAYGMTEAAHQMASNPLPPGERRPGSVGRGTGVEVAVLGEGGRPRPPGELGEVAVRGPNVMDGYEANPVANEEAFVDGWFRTGDQGTLDASGYLSLRGRIKELINRGGEKIAPQEVDDVLRRHPAVAEAVTFAVPHPAWGEEVAAAVVLKDGAEVGKRELIDFSRQHLADFKVPRQLYIVDQIPRTATGKVQRRHVAATFTSA